MQRIDRIDCAGFGHKIRNIPTNNGIKLTPQKIPIMPAIPHRLCLLAPDALVLKTEAVAAGLALAGCPLGGGGDAALGHAVNPIAISTPASMSAPLT